MVDDELAAARAEGMRPLAGLDALDEPRRRPAHVVGLDHRAEAARNADGHEAGAELSLDALLWAPSPRR